MGWLNKLFHLDLSKPAEEKAPKPINTSKDSACNRLKLVLMHDRTQLSPTIIENMRDELVEVISKYVEIDKTALELNLESESNTIALVANIPVLRSRTTS
jgi:cell division topological specificity factor